MTRGVRGGLGGCVYERDEVAQLRQEVEAMGIELRDLRTRDQWRIPSSSQSQQTGEEETAHDDVEFDNESTAESRWSIGYDSFVHWDSPPIYDDYPEDVYCFNVELEEEKIYYIIQKFGIEEEKVPDLCLSLYKDYGTTMAGLKAMGYNHDFDYFHAARFQTTALQWAVKGSYSSQPLDINKGLRLEQMRNLKVGAGIPIQIRNNPTLSN